MQRLRPTDGTPAHRRAAQYHVSECRTVDQPLHKKLGDDMQAMQAALIKAARAVEDAQDLVTAATAIADAVELALENTVRDLDGELAKIDRNDPTEVAQKSVFPDGFGVVIEAERGAQIEALKPVARALKPLRGAHKSINAPAAELEKQTAQLTTALAAVKAAEEKVEALFEQEIAARRAIREQMEVAYGALRGYYKARPAIAERFFVRDGNNRRTPASPVTQPSVPAAPAPSPPKID